MKRPVAVLVIAALYIAVGLGGLVVHFPRYWHTEDVWIELTEALAVICGVFLLRAKNWARWLALTWMAFHVAISFPIFRQVAVHLAFLIVIAWFLFRPGVGRYFAIRTRDGT